MAATCELVHKETGRKTWHYTIDAKELLAQPDSPYQLTGATRKSGRATPSAPAALGPRIQPKTPEQVQADAIALGIQKGMEAVAGALGLPGAPASQSDEQDEMNAALDEALNAEAEEAGDTEMEIPTPDAEAEDFDE